MASQPTILATSGGMVPSGRNFLQRQFGPLLRFALELSGKDRPRLCYLGTAAGDSDVELRVFYGACVGEAVDPSHLQLFTMPNVENVEEHLRAQDVIWVGGGSVANLLAVWRVHELDRMLRQAWDQGIVLGGVSAGSICWHAGGPTDSFGPQLRGISNGLGLLPYSNGVHYNTDPRRRPVFQSLVASGELPDGYATDDGVGLLYRGTRMVEAVTEIPGGKAYSVSRTSDGGVRETVIEPRMLA